MKDAVVYLVASGRAFFWGVFFIELAVGLAFIPKRRGQVLARTVALSLGVILIAVSSTPLSGEFYLASGLVTLAWLVVEGSKWSARVRLLRWIRAAIALAWLLGLVLEMPFQAFPRLPRLGNPPVYIVGDSLGAGIGGESATWPRILADSHRMRVHDLSRAGATVASAEREQAARVIDPDSLVIVEVGGNDILGNTSPEAFERGLDGLLARLGTERRTVVMLELPLPPFYNRFGAIQRRLAKRHGVRLVPKWVLMRVVTTRGATVDTLHLSTTGHELLAAAVWDVIRPAFGR